MNREAIEALDFLSLNKDLEISERTSFCCAVQIAVRKKNRIGKFCVLSSVAYKIAKKNCHHNKVASIIGVKIDGAIPHSATLQEEMATGALSSANKKCDTFGIYVEALARPIKEPSRGPIAIEKNSKVSQIHG